MEKKQRFFTKKMIPFLICGILGWVLCIGSFLYLKIDTNKRESQEIAATADRDSIRNARSNRRTRQGEEDSTPIASSARRFDTLTATEKMVIEDICRGITQYNSELDATFFAILTDDDCLVLTIDAWSITSALAAKKDNIVSEGLKTAQGIQDSIYNAIGKRIDYGYAVFYDEELIYYETAGKGVIIQ